MDFKELKDLIREMIEDEILEFSGVAALGGGPILPLGASPSDFFKSDLVNPEEEKKTKKSKRRKNKNKR